MSKEKAVVLLSGGMDSTTLVYDVLSEGYGVFPISYFYGQKHSKELEAAAATCHALNLTHKVLDVRVLGEVAPSSLTRGEQVVPTGHYQEESMKQTVVPNRNMVLLSLAVAYAIGIGAETVWYGAHGGDHAIYPDCRPEFISAMQEAIALCDWHKVGLNVPYTDWTKADILRRGLELGVDYSLSWTCYVGEELACGECGACTERLESFAINNVKDPLQYTV